MRALSVHPDLIVFISRVWQTTCTILTTSANALLESYHDRMPVIVADRDADDWMDPRAPDPQVTGPRARRFTDRNSGLARRQQR